MRPTDLFRPASVLDVTCIKNPNSDELIKSGFFRAEWLVNMSGHNYELAPLEVGVAT